VTQNHEVKRMQQEENNSIKHQKVISCWWEYKNIRNFRFSQVSDSVLTCWITKDWRKTILVKFSASPVHRCRSRQIFGGAKDFCQNLPKLARKVFVRLLPTNFLPQGLRRTFVAWRPKNGFVVIFCKRLAPFLPRFSGILPGFSTNQNLGVRLHPASYTTDPVANRDRFLIEGVWRLVVNVFYVMYRAGLRYIRTLISA